MKNPKIELLVDSYLDACKDMDSWADEDKIYSQQYKKNRAIAEDAYWKLKVLGVYVVKHADIRPRHRGNHE